MLTKTLSLPNLNSSESQQYKQQENEDLCILNKMIELLSMNKSNLLNLNNENSDNNSSETNIIKKKSNSNDKIFMKNTINDLKHKLSETKNFVSSYQVEINDYISKLIEYNQSLCSVNSNNESNVKEDNNKVKFDLELVDNGNEKPSFTHSIDEQKQSIDYSKLFDLITEKKDHQECEQEIGKSSNDQEKAFILKMIEHLNTTKANHSKEIEDLKASMQTIKTNINAQKQIWFNEAIKSVTKQKEKQIEDYKIKQDDYLSKINQLEAELAQLKSDSNNKNDSNKQEVLKHKVEKDTQTKELILSDDMNETKSKLREILLQEKVNQLEKQLAMFSTLPLTNNYYETIQLNSCNVDDLVLAVYSEEHGSYRVIHKTSTYMFFVHSAIFKNYEQRLTNKSNQGSMMTIPPSSPSCSNLVQQQSTIQSNNDLNTLGCSSTDLMQQNSNNSTSTAMNYDMITSIKSILPSVAESPANNYFEANSSTVENYETPFSSLPSINENNNKQQQLPQWFVGKVLTKEFCVARKVCHLNF
jgi:hypothetical protein